MAEPILGGLPASLSYTFGDAATPIAPLLTVTDADSANLASASVRIVGGSFVGDGDILTADTTGTAIHAVWNAANGTLFLSGSDTVENYQAVLRTVSYESTATDPGNSGGSDARTIAWQVSDGTTLATSLFTAASTFAGAANPRYVATADLDGDGNLDLVSSAYSGTGVSVFLGNGDGTFGAGIAYATGAGTHGVAVGDLNGDGIADIAATWGGGAAVLIGNGDGTFGSATTLNASGTWAVSITDLNHDGKNDVVGAGSGNVVFLGNGDGTFAAGVPYATSTSPHGMAFGDFDGDGNVDIASSTTSGTSILLGAGDGTFGSPTIFNSGAFSWSVAAGDFNGDSILDLATPDAGVTILIGQGDGSFASGGSLTSGASPFDVAVRDFNADGKLDIATTALSAAAVSIFLGNGDGTFQSAINASVGAAPFGIAIGDFDGEGGVDIATANANSTNSILLNQTPGLSATEKTTIELVDPSTIPAHAVGSEVLVNSTTAGDQLYEKVAGLTNGTFAVTWQDVQTIKAQVLDASGDFVGTEISVSPPGLASESPEIASLVGGNFVAVWTDRSSDFDVRAQVYDASGGTVGSQILVNTTTADLQQSPKITSLSDGGFAVTWQDRNVASGDGDNYSIKAQVFDADGGAVGTEILVNSATAGSQLSPLITSLENGFVVTWIDNSQGVGGTIGDSSQSAVKAQVFDNTGSKVGSEILVNTATANAQNPFDIKPLTGGGFVVVWNDASLGANGATGDSSGGAVKAQVFTDGGARIGSEILVNTATSGDQYTPVLAALARGGFVVAWTDNSQGIDGATGDSSFTAVKAQVFTAAGTKVGSEILVNTATSSYQSLQKIVAFPNGGFAIVWSDNSQGVDGATGDNDSYAVKAQFFDANGGPVGDEILVNTATASSQSSPEIAAIGNTTAIVWIDHSLGVNGATGDTSGWAIKAQLYSFGSAPTGADNTITTDEDTGHTFSASDFGFADADGDTLAAVRIDSLPSDGSVELNGTPVVAGDVIDAADIGQLVFTPGANDNGAAYTSFTFSVKDSSGSFDTTPRTITVDVTPLDDPPTGADNTITTDEDTAHTFSASDFGFSDVDGDTLAAVRIDAVPGAGSLELNGTPVVDGDVIAIADIGLLVFIPGTDDNGTGYASFTFSVKDSAGTFDTTPRTITVDVTPVDDPPTGADKTVTFDEDTTYTFSASDFGFADVDGDTFAAVRIDTLPLAGSLKLDGNLVGAGDVIDAADIGLLVFTPAPDNYGSGYTIFTFSVKDGAESFDTTPRTITFDVNGIDDPPSGADKTVTTDEDTGYTFAESDFGFSDVDGDTLAAVRIDSLPLSGSLTLDGDAVTVGDVIDSADIGLLVFTPAGDESGTDYASFTFSVKDSFGTFDTTSRTITVDVTPVDDPPSGADKTITIDEDTTHTFLASDFGFSDVDGDSLAALRIDGLPLSGTLTLDGNPVSAGDLVDAASIGLLIFMPGNDENGSGYASFTFSVEDDVGTFDTTSRTITFDVTPVDDPPLGADKTITLAEDTNRAFSASDFGFSDVDGDTLAAIRIDSLPGAGSLSLNGNPVAAGSVVSNASLPLLVFTPDLNGNGVSYASFTFSVKDSAGTFDTTPNTVTFNLTPVNDAPVIASNGGGDAAAVTIAENTTAVTQVVAIDPDGTAAFSIGGGADAALFTIGPADGTLAFLSAPDFETPGDADGDNIYEVVVQAGDGLASDSQTIIVTVANVDGVTIIGIEGKDKVDATTTVAGQPLPTGEEDLIRGRTGNDVLSGLGGDDHLTAGHGADKLYGGAGNDLLKGFAENDRLFGGDGDDILFGGRGHDRLHGGAGADLFGFDAALWVGNADRIEDFTTGEDLIGLDHDRFAAIGASLEADEFKLGGRARDGNDHVLFKRSSGGVYYDADGKGGDAKVLFAKVDPGTHLHFDDFVIV